MGEDKSCEHMATEGPCTLMFPATPGNIDHKDEKIRTLVRRDRVLDEVGNERERQERLRVEGKFPHTCASDGLNHSEKLAVLAEEFGEVARHVTEWIIAGNRLDKMKLRKELIEVAAVAVAWAESLESK